MNTYNPEQKTWSECHFSEPLVHTFDTFHASRKMNAEDGGSILLKEQFFRVQKREGRKADAWKGASYKIVLAIRREDIAGSDDKRAVTVDTFIDVLEKELQKVRDEGKLPDDYKIMALS